MSSTDHKMSVDKTVPRRAALCVTCEHEAAADDVWPCNCCWNPVGDMYRRRVPIQLGQKPVHSMKDCPLCGSNQVQLCSDANNPMKNQCKCRECGCSAPRAAWDGRRAPTHQPAPQTSGKEGEAK